MGMTTKSRRGALITRSFLSIKAALGEVQIPQKVFIVKIKVIFALHVASTLYTNVQ